VIRRVVLTALLVGSGLVAGLVISGRLHLSDEVVAEPASAPAAQSAGVTPVALSQSEPPRPLVGGPDFTDIAARTVGAVTNISSLTPVQRQNSPFDNDPFFKYFFGDMDVFGPDDQGGLTLGSGVVVSPDGYILTNVHVLGSLTRGTEVRVGLSDKRDLRAQVVGADSFTDIALIKIKAHNLATIPWGDSSKLRVAEWVLAIGNPYQLNQTVTLGIVSALRRSNIGAAGYEEFIQTDAAINPGNSGGALVNSRGELVGINTAIYSKTGGYQGIGFAVPSNLARRVMNDLIRYGEVRRGSVGYFETMALTPDLAAQLHSDRTSGVVISRMERASDAYAAGLRPGDIVVQFNGTAVDDGAQLQRLIADAPVGSTARFQVLRGPRSLSLTVPVSQAVARRASSY
jgi:serine protease Do